MKQEDEERRKRLEEANNIINNINNKNTTNINNDTYSQRFQEANSIIESINPSKEKIREVTEEEKAESVNNLNKFLGLIDENTKAIESNKTATQNTSTNREDIRNDNLQRQALATAAGKTQARMEKEIYKQNKKEADAKAIKAQNAKIQSMPTVNKNGQELRTQNNNIVDNRNISFASDYNASNITNVTSSDVKAIREAEERNKRIEKGGADKFFATTETILKNIQGGTMSSVAGLANVLTTATALGAEGVKRLAGLFGQDEAANQIGNFYDNVVEAGSQISAKASHESNVTARLENTNIRTAGMVSNVISEMVTNSSIGFIIPGGNTGRLGTAIQGLSVGGRSAQEVLDENKDNIGQATITGLAKGYVSYLTERMFDANILTKGQGGSISNKVDDIIYNSIKSNFGKKFASKTVDILGENVEELVEDNIDNIIDRIINDKEFPTIQEWLDNTSETAKVTTISTIIMSLLGLGGTNFQGKEENVITRKVEQYINDNSLAIQFKDNIIAQEDKHKFYIANFANDGQVISIQQVSGKEINNPNKKINISPVIIKNNSNNYNVIDNNTGLLLDSAPYRTQIEAQNRFDEKIINLDDSTIKNINNKIAQADVSVQQKTQQVIAEAQNEINAQQTSQKNARNDIENGAKNVMNEPQSGLNNVNASSKFKSDMNKFVSGKYTQTDAITVLETLPDYFYNLGYETDKPLILNMNKLETIMKEPKGNFNGKNQHGITMDIIEQIPAAIKEPLNVIKNPNYRNRFVVVTNLTDQYGDIILVPVEINNNAEITGINKITSIYGKETYDIPSKDNLKSYMEQNKENIVYDIDNKNSISSNYRLQLPSKTRNTSTNSISQNETNMQVNSKIGTRNNNYDADLSNTDTTQASQNEFTDDLSNEATNYMSQSKKMNIEKNNVPRVYRTQIEDFKTKAKSQNRINGNVIEMNTNIFENVSKKKQSSFLNEYLKNEVKGHDYYVDGQKIIANGTTIGKLKNGKTNFDKRISNNIRSELKSNIIANLDSVISNSILYQSDKVDTKNHSFADKFDRRKSLIRYNNQNYEIMFETGKKNNVNTLYGIESIKKVNKNRLSLPKLTSKKGLQNTNNVVDGSRKSNASITRNSKNVNNNANVNNNSMHNNENNTRNEQKAIQKELHNRIQNAILSRNSKGRTYLGDVSTKISNKIKSLFGFEVSDKRHVLADNDIRHMIKEHGNPEIEKAKGQIAITTKDIEKIPDIIENYDRIVEGNDNREGKTIRYIKNYSDNISYVVEVVPEKGNALKIKTMWKKPVRVTNSKNTPSLTSKTKSGLGVSTSSKSIPHNKQNVKDSGIRAEKTKTTRNKNAKDTTSQPYDARRYEKNSDFMGYLRENNYLKTLMEVDETQGETYAHSFERRIEQEIRDVENTGAFDNTIPVTKLSDIDKMVEDFLGINVMKGHFRQRARGIYNSKTDTIRVKELKDMDNVLHEMGHALDLGNRIQIDKKSIATELLEALKQHGGYENDTRAVQLDEGFAEIVKEYAINSAQVKVLYPQTYSILEAERQQNAKFNDFMSKLQGQIYNYIHQIPQNRTLSNMSIGERTDRPPITPNLVKENVVKWVWDRDYTIKEMTNELAKASDNKLSPSQNIYLLTRLASGVNNKAISMISDGYIDLNGNRVMPGLNKLGEILGNDPQRWNDLRAYLVAKRDLEYKAKSLKTGIRTMDSKAVVEQFYNDAQIQEAAQFVYDTLDGVLQYAVDNGLINNETANSLRESNAFYVPFQRVIEGKGNKIGRRGAVSDVINRRTGSELDIKDVLENIVTNSANIIQQVENNNILRLLASQGEAAGMKNNIFEEIPAPMKKVGTAELSIWEAELKKQGVDTSNLDLEQTIDIFVPNTNIITEKDGSHIVSYFDNEGNRKYLQFYKESTDIFNGLMGLDKNANSAFLKIMRAANMPLRYGATMANVGFAIPNMISDTVQATIYSGAGFIPVVDNIIGVLDVLGSTNKSVRNFLNKYAPEYAERINRLYEIYQQTGASSSTRMSQYRKSAQEIMRDIYGTKNSEVLGIKESFKPLKRLMDLLTYIPELSESSTRFRVFEKNYKAYKKKGGAELDARVKAAIESRDATQDFGRTGTVMREINQLIPFSAARVGSAYTFAEKIKTNPKRTSARIAILLIAAMAIKGIGYDEDEIEELNQRKKDDNFVIKIGNTVFTIKKPQGILRSIINLVEYTQDLFTGHIEDGKEGERLVEWATNAIMDNMPADSVTGLVPNAIAPVVENAINKDFYYNTDIVKSYDLDLPEAQQYYDYTSQFAIWIGKIFNYSPAKIDNLISGYFGGLGTQFTNILDWFSAKLGINAEKPAMGAEDNAIGKRFVVNVNENSASVDEIYSREEELTKKLNGGTITEDENIELENIKAGISKMSALNKQIKAIKQDLKMSGTEKANKIRPLQEQKVDVARQALGKEPIYTKDANDLDTLQFYPSRSTLNYNGYALELTEDMKQEYMNLAYDTYKQYEKQGLYSKEYLKNLESKCKDYAKKTMFQKYKNKLSN